MTLLQCLNGLTVKLAYELAGTGRNDQDSYEMSQNDLALGHLHTILKFTVLVARSIASVYFSHSALKRRFRGLHH